MNQQDKFAEKALEHFKAGHHCSESTILALAEYLGVKSPLIPRIATGLHGGFGGAGLICGAISGGVLALGIKFGRDDLQLGPWTASERVRELVAAFKQEIGTIYCSEITQADLTDPEQVKRFVATRRIPICGEKAVRFAVRKTIEIIERGDTPAASSGPSLTGK